MSENRYDLQFFAGQSEGSLAAARTVLPRVFDLAGKPSSLVDVGCGVGTWVSVATELGVPNVLGIDGPWVSPEQLLVSPDRFLAGDIVQTLKSLAEQGRCFELVLCLEVAEHLQESEAPPLVSGLSAVGDLVLFSAAIPHQGGTHHVNEAWPDYWEALFRASGFQCFDPLRRLLWDEPRLEWWYAQNILLFARGQAKDRLQARGLVSGVPARLVHPGQFQALWDRYERLTIQHRNLLSSRAWRLTAPLRILARRLGL